MKSTLIHIVRNVVSGVRSRHRPLVVDLRSRILLLPLAFLGIVPMLVSAMVADPTRPAAHATFPSHLLGSSPTSTLSPLSTPSIDARVATLEARPQSSPTDRFLSQANQWKDLAQGVITSGAIIVSGFWACHLFVRRRQKYPRASISHHIAHVALEEGKLLLCVSTNITNLGEILLSLVRIETRIQQVLPLPHEVQACIALNGNPVPAGATEVSWPILDSHEVELKSYEIEPGESQEYQHDFILDSPVKAVKVYSYIKNAAKHDREIGWDATTLYDLEQTKDGPMDGKE